LKKNRGLIHISQLSNERVDKPSSLYKVDDELDALVVQLDPKERRIGLSIKAVKQHEEREEMQAYLKREHEAAAILDGRHPEGRAQARSRRRRAARGARRQNQLDGEPSALARANRRRDR